MAIMDIIIEIMIKIMEKYPLKVLMMTNLDITMDITINIITIMANGNQTLRMMENIHHAMEVLLLLH